MLSLHPNPDKLRAARNLLPRVDGSVYTRPGAVQVVTGRIGRAVAWGNRVLMEKDRKLVLWDFVQDHDLGDAGLTLQAVPYQAVVNGEREDRLYVADGQNALWYLKKSGATYVKTTVVNTVLDESNQPYAIPVPFAIAAWQNRLWIADDSHRVYHCQNERPEQWDPLWTIEAQGAGPDVIRVMKPLGDQLVLGLTNSLWAISGTSQYNWQRSELVRGLGVNGIDAMTSFTNRLWFVDQTGLFELGNPLPLTDDLRRAFDVQPYGSQCVVDPVRRVLFLVVNGLAYCSHIDAQSPAWTQLHGFGVQGLVATDSLVGYYGEDGLWIFAQDQMADAWKSGQLREIETVYDTWDHRPNVDAGGRALLNRMRMIVSGPQRQPATYTVRSPEALFSATLELSDTLSTWGGLPAAVGDPWPYAPVEREFVPMLSGATFRHTVQSLSPLEIQMFKPTYRFAGAA